jgi:cytosine permease
MAEPLVPLPPILQAELASQPQMPGPWYRTILPAYLGLFSWAPFFDQLWVSDLPRHGLPWLFGTAFVASLVCLCLFYLAASWGLTARRPLGIVAASTFGTSGSEWITGVAIAAAQVVWYAVAIDFAVDSILVGLRACGLIEPRALAGWHLGPVEVKSPVYLCTALFWIYITGTAGLLRLTGVVVALMRVYAPVAVLLLTAVALWMLPSLGSYRVDDAVVLANAQSLRWPWGGHDRALQLVVGFFALASLTSVDWGAAVRCRRDLMLGGLTGIALAAWWTASMSLVVVAGGVARMHHHGGWLAASTNLPAPLSFRWAVYHGIEGVPAGTILILFGLAALAPACYSASAYAEKLSIHWPRLRQSGWTWLGGGLAFGLAATQAVSRLALIYSAMGNLFAPVVGAIAGDWLLQRGRWSGPRYGVNRAGLIAWGTGFLITLFVGVQSVVGPGFLKWTPPASICGFAVSLILYLLMASIGWLRPVVAVSRQDLGH